MSLEYEEEFVEKFLTKNKRERLLFELSSTKKREHAIGHFCHNTLDYIDENKIVYMGNTLSNSELIKKLRSYSMKSLVYIISWNENLDGSLMEVDKAINEIEEEGMASIIMLGNAILIKTEQEQGAAVNYILYSKN
ncbi:hypothetical protein [Anaerosporobacter faecicola]|uniref:hypothetical protein n=1 Tax=Anaerosporobacter faecicola TaxID=2718714 RepID=UPI00143C89BC|nr:hypothetical protein [Anaerosporobacter faecicola]